METRVKSGIWVAMVLRLGQRDGRYGTVVRRGDEDAGGVLVVLRAGADFWVLSQMRGEGGEAGWLRATGPTPVDEGVADAYVARQVRVDPDLWVLEFEGRDGMPPFEGRIVG